MQQYPRILIVGLILSAVITPHTLLAQAPQDDRLERREYQIRQLDVSTNETMTPPQTDRAERRAYEARLKEVQEIKELNDSYQEARRLRAEANNRTDEAEQLERQEQYIATQQALLARTGQALLNYLSALEHRAENIQNEAFQNRALNTIREQIAAVNILIARIDTADTREALVAIAEEFRLIRSQMSEASSSISAESNAMKLVILDYIDRFEAQYLRKAQERAQKIEEALTRLEEQGYSVDTARALLTAANERIAFSTAELQSIRDRVTSAESLKGGALASIRVSLNNVKNGMKTLYDTYLEIAEHVRAL